MPQNSSKMEGGENPSTRKMTAIKLFLANNFRTITFIIDKFTAEK